MSFNLLFGIGLFCVLIFLLANHVDDKKQHALFKLMVFFFIIASVILLAKASFDDKTICENKLNTTLETYYYGENYSNNWQGSGTPPESATTPELFNKTVVNNYSTYCYDSTDQNTSLIFYRLVLAFVVIFFIYVLVYYSYSILKFAGDSFKKR